LAPRILQSLTSPAEKATTQDLASNFRAQVPAPNAKKGHCQVLRSVDEWVAIPVPPIIDEQTFTAASKAKKDNSKWSPRRAEPGQWLLKGPVRCGVCGVGTNAHRMRGRNGSWHRYYYCRKHDPIRAGGADRRCPERNIRADALDAYVFDRIRSALLHPGTMLAGEQAVAARTPAPDDELTSRRDDLTAQRRELSRDNKIRSRVQGFAERITAVIDHLDPEQKQKLLRLLIEEVRVTGWNVQIQLRIPLDAESQDQPPPGGGPRQDRLRSIRGDDVRMMHEPVDRGGRRPIYRERRHAQCLLTGAHGVFDLWKSPSRGRQAKRVTPNSFGPPRHIAPMVTG
jgi:site-specific DNA recombinase